MQNPGKGIFRFKPIFWELKIILIGSYKAIAKNVLNQAG